MKKLIKYMMLFLCILLMTGCSNKKSVGGKNITTANSVDKIINEQINNENKDKTTDNKNLLSSNDSSKGTENAIKDTEGTQKTKGTVDYDLTQMSSDLVYATVYQMMVTPEEYEGKRSESMEISMLHITRLQKNITFIALFRMQLPVVLREWNLYGEMVHIFIQRSIRKIMQRL